MQSIIYILNIKACRRIILFLVAFSINSLQVEKRVGKQAKKHDGSFPNFEYDLNHWMKALMNDAALFAKICQPVCFHFAELYSVKVENILKGILDLIPSPSPSMKIQIMSGKFCLRSKGKTLMGVVNKHLKTKILLTSPSNVWPYYLKEIFPPII